VGKTRVPRAQRVWGDDAWDPGSHLTTEAVSRSLIRPVAVRRRDVGALLAGVEHAEIGAASFRSS
jgi:hypothetical protein